MTSSSPPSPRTFTFPGTIYESSTDTLNKETWPTWGGEAPAGPPNENLPFLIPGHSSYRRIENFELRKDDLFVSTWPKSGTTWMQNIVWQLRNKGIEVDKDISYLVPYVESRAIRSDEEETDITKMEGPRSFKTHFPLSFYPLARANSVTENPLNVKFIYVIRSPEKVVSSFYRYVNQFPGLFENEGADMNFAARLFCDGHLFYGSYFDHINDAWLQRGLPNVLVVQFEDLLSDRQQQLARIAKFLEISLSEEEMERVMHFTGYDYMHKNSKFFSGLEYSQKLVGKDLQDNFSLVRGKDEKRDGLSDESLHLLRKTFVQKCAQHLNCDNYDDLKF